MKEFSTKIKSYVIGHKVLSVIIIVVAVLLVRYIYTKVTSTTGELRYITTTVSKGTIISSVTGTGQIAASSQIDLKPNVSGTVTHIAVHPGDTVWRGETLFSIDDTDARKALRDAQASLDVAKLDLATTQAQMGNTDTNQDTNIINAYRVLLNSGLVATTGDLFSNVTPPIISGTYTGDKEGVITVNVYQASNGSYFSATGLVKGDGLVSDTTPQPIGNSGLYIKFSTLGSEPQWTISIPNIAGTNYLSNYNAYQATLQSKNQTGSASQLSSLSVQAKELAVQQRQNALLDAQEHIADYSVKAPFSGTVASVAGIEGATASAGTALATLITTQKIATISLNEVDVAKIKLGEKTTLTFDAIPDLTIAGKVAEIDSVGTVSQGVVTYNVKVSFDTPDDRVKPGMSVSAAIITDVKQDVLLVPNSAVKSQNGASYIEMFDAPLVAPTDGLQGTLSKITPNKISVEIGVSNDSQTEIVSGVVEGDAVVSRTISSSAIKTTNTPSLFGSSSGGATRGAVPRGN